MATTPNSQATTPSPLLSSSSNLVLDAPRPPSPNRKRSLQDAHIDSDHPSPNYEALLKRTHYGKLAHELRARLSYASFKTAHNLVKLPFPTLEQQYAVEKQPRPPPSSLNVRHAPSPRQSQRLTSAQLMPPPKSTASPRSRTRSQQPSGSQSLYSALLDPRGMPPPKRAKTSPNRSHGHQRSLSSPFSDFGPQSGRTIRSIRTDPNAGPDDINAAATLTALLLNRPNSRSEGRASSLSRSSSTASIAATAVQSSQGASSSFYGSQGVATTGPSTSQTARPKTPPPVDKQAAELMLFLATSPSPAQSSHRRTSSESHTGQLLSKARVLFGSSDSASDIPSPARSGSVDAALGSSSQLLPAPGSPHAGGSQPFDIGEYIFTSPFPSQSNPKQTPKKEGRRLFVDDDGPTDTTSTTPKASAINRSQSMTDIQFTAHIPTPSYMPMNKGKSPTSNNATEKAVMGTLSSTMTPVLGPAMGANA